MGGSNGDDGRPRILVPQPIRPEGLELLREAGRVELIETDRMLSHDELVAALRRNDYMLAIGDQTIGGDLLDANPELKGISFAAPHPEEWMDVPAATARGIPVTKISGAPVVQTTGDLTMALLLGLAWRLVEADRWTKSGRFRQEQSTTFMCHSVDGKTLGMVGLGKVGRQVVPRARSFDMRVIYTKRTRLSPEEEAELGIEWVPTLHELLPQSDFVSLHADHNPSTEDLIDATALEQMRDTAFLINTARGRIVDEAALVEALRTGGIAGAGLDVYVGEPPVTPTPDPNPELLKLDNVILCPHIGGQTEESLSQIALLGARNLVALIEGGRPPALSNADDLLNPELYADA